MMRPPLFPAFRRMQPEKVPQIVSTTGTHQFNLRRARVMSGTGKRTSSCWNIWGCNYDELMWRISNWELELHLQVTWSRVLKNLSWDANQHCFSGKRNRLPLPTLCTLHMSSQKSMLPIATPNLWLVSPLCFSFWTPGIPQISRVFLIAFQQQVQCRVWLVVSTPLNYWGK